MIPALLLATVLAPDVVAIAAILILIVLGSVVAAAAFRLSTVRRTRAERAERRPGGRT